MSERGSKRVQCFWRLRGKRILKKCEVVNSYVQPKAQEPRGLNKGHGIYDWWLESYWWKYFKSSGRNRNQIPCSKYQLIRKWEGRKRSSKNRSVSLKFGRKWMKKWRGRVREYSRSGQSNWVKGKVGEKGSQSEEEALTL